MKRLIKAGPKSRGQALIMAMIFLVALTFLGFGLVTMATLDSASAKSLRISAQVLEAAEEGIIAGMAYSADPNVTPTPFKYLPSVAPGNSVTFKSGDYYATDVTNKLQYRVTVVMRGLAPAIPGYDKNKFDFKLVEVRSTGYVYERPFKSRNVAFDFANTPAIRRNIRVFARIVVAKD